MYNLKSEEKGENILAQDPGYTYLHSFVAGKTSRLGMSFLSYVRDFGNFTASVSTSMTGKDASRS